MTNPPMINLPMSDDWVCNDQQDSSDRWDSCGLKGVRFLLRRSWNKKGIPKRKPCISIEAGHKNRGSNLPPLCLKMTSIQDLFRICSGSVRDLFGICSGSVRDLERYLRRAVLAGF
jgi:hypothetical protein